jgi:hypothetical protein
VSDLDLQLHDSLRRLTARAEDRQADWRDVLARAERAHRRMLAAVASAAVFGLALIATAAAFGPSLWHHLVAGKPVPKRSLSPRELEQLEEISTGSRGLLSLAEARQLNAYGKIRSIRLLATRGRYTFYVIHLLGRNPGETRFRPESCYAIGRTNAPAGQRFGLTGCSPDAQVPFPSRRFPVMDFSIFGRRVNERGFHIDRLAGFAADAVNEIVIVRAGDVISRTPVRDNVYLRVSGLPTGSFDKIEALDERGRSVWTTPLARVRPVPGRRPPPPPPAAKPVPPATPPFQRGRANGVSVVVGRNGVAVFTREAPSPEVAKLLDGDVGYTCFRFERTLLGVQPLGLALDAYRPLTAQTKVQFQPRGPYDGCEVDGYYGHRWPDRFGSHSLVEIAFTPRARRYFADRATARDLALLVRSRRMQQLRRDPAAIASAYGSALVRLSSRTAFAPVGRIGYWTGDGGVTFGETSPTGLRFYVRVESGRIVRQNLGSLAFVF